MANPATAMAISTMALRALVRNAILTDMAPTWAKAAATAAAARNGMNMRSFRGYGWGQRKAPRAARVGGRKNGDALAYAVVASVMGGCFLAESEAWR